ncbi:MAG: phosphotransferase [Candidatus Syntrophoarchaeum butanivorans]|uniref:Phosphotransferase n=2 Tax=Candidatus Syntropharchaeum butanivorans TaxID=1839936 RepID=A0A1F2P775_9EURY|nr:MAG: phosphotransferase [Candidatus Syntrophoarchaeum butanivorans]
MPIIINADLHIHSHYAAASSREMTISRLAREGPKKGINLIGSGDCLHPGWLAEMRAERRIFDRLFIPTCEVEDSNRVHHLIILPSLTKAEELREAFAPYSVDIDTNGRPRVNLSGCEIAEAARDVEALIGPAHAFTPWTSLYACYDSLSECYEDMVDYIAFIELGLSADTSYADMISRHHDLTFLTNSDAHSPWPIRLAREFNRFEMEDTTFDELKMAILRKKGRRPILNVGLPPEEGKYNRTACTRCYRQFDLEEAVKIKWRCECGGLIKKGVFDRVRELADLEKPYHPPHRPPYLHLIPLSEIISLAIGHGVNTKAVRDLWEELVLHFGSEVAVLLDAEPDELEGFDERIVYAISAFRDGRIIVEPGGGGKYGTIKLPERDERKPPKGQRSLFDAYGK